MEENVALAALTALLVSFRDETPRSHGVAIAECGNLHQPIAALYEPAGRADCDPIAGASAGAPLLYVQGRYFQGAKRTIDPALDRLWEMLGEHLIRCKFSFRDGAYRRLGAEERDYLEGGERWLLRGKRLAPTRA